MSISHVVAGMQREIADAIQSMLQVRMCECVIVLLTRDVLSELHSLLAVWCAVANDVPVLTVFSDRGGYDYGSG